jgi:hypothetical protein
MININRFKSYQLLLLFFIVIVVGCTTSKKERLPKYVASWESLTEHAEWIINKPSFREVGRSCFCILNQTKLIIYQLNHIQALWSTYH